MIADEFNRDLINRLSVDNSAVYYYLTAYANNYLTYEQALIGMVSSLVNQNNELVKLQIKRLELSAFTYKT